MTTLGIFQILFYLAVIVALTRPMGAFMAQVFQGERTFLHPLFRPLEKLMYRLSGVREEVEQHWTHYAGALIAFSIAKFVFTYLIQRLQGWLPLNPQGFGTAQAAQSATTLTPDLAFNTAVSFVTNTNWQSYVGETTVSYFVQMAALTVQNFTSAAAGMAIAIALVRGFARHETKTIGNFWVDVTRATVYILLPLSFVAALIFASQGVIQNWDPYTQATTLEGATQVIAQGPVASQEAIKELGTNGGGFFNANSSHPFENPTPFTTFFQVVLIFAHSGGTDLHVRRDGERSAPGVVAAGSDGPHVFIGVFASYWAEQRGNPIVAAQGIETAATDAQPGGNMEGKEVRFGIAQSVLFAIVTTAASCGAVNAMHDSFTPLGGLVPLFNMQTGEVIFGGVGAGLYGILLYAILAVFIAGLMVGRTPEYLGKKIEQKEVKMAMLALIATAASILVFTGMSAVLEFAKDSYWNPMGPTTANLNNTGPHGLAEILYAYTSATGNNGSAFAGITANTPWYNLSLGVAMLIGRFLSCCRCSPPQAAWRPRSRFR